MNDCRASLTHAHTLTPSFISSIPRSEQLLLHQAGRHGRPRAAGCGWRGQVRWLGRAAGRQPREEGNLQCRFTLSPRPGHPWQGRAEQRQEGDDLEPERRSGGGGSGGPPGGWRKELQSGVLTSLGSPSVLQPVFSLGVGCPHLAVVPRGMATSRVALLKWCENRSRGLGGSVMSNSGGQLGWVGAGLQRQGGAGKGRRGAR